MAAGAPCDVATEEVLALVAASLRDRPLTEAEICVDEAVQRAALISSVVVGRVASQLVNRQKASEARITQLEAQVCCHAPVQVWALCP